MGGQRYSRPSQVGSAPRESQLSDFDSFDRSGLVNQMVNQLQSRGGQQQAKALASASKLGIGRSSGTVGQLATIAGDTENRIAQAQGEAALASWNDKLKQKQMRDSFNQNKYQQDLDKYKYELGLHEAERAKKRAWLGPFGG